MADAKQIIDSAREFAASSLSSASSLVDNAVGVISGLGTSLNLQTPLFNLGPQLPPPSVPPVAETVDFSPPTAPTAPRPASIPTLDLPLVPTSSFVRPTFQEPVKPNGLRQLSTPAPAIVTSFEFPEPPAALDVTIPVPTMGTYAVPVKPTVSMPVFSAIKPNDDVSPPSDYVERYAAAYQEQAPSMVAALNGHMDAMLARINPRFAEQMASLEARLAKFIEGGTGLSAAIEDAIYSRSRGKVAAETRRSREVAYGDAARRGFLLPPGAVNAAVNQAQQAGADNNARAATEIAIKQAELEQQNVQFAITTSAALRNAVLSAALSYHSNLINVNGQALSYAQSLLNAAIQVYDTLVKAFTAKLDAYRAEAGVYEVQIRGVLATVEVYKAEIDALKALTEVDTQKVAIYSAQISALEALSRVYRSRIEVVQSRASIEKTKVELYGEQVRAYAVEAQAKASEWQGYAAAVGGQEAQQRAFGEEVRAFSAQIEGYRAVVQAKSEEVRAKTSINESAVRQYSASVDGYRAVVDGMSRIAASKIDLSRISLDAYQAKVAADDARAKTSFAYYNLKATMAQEDTKLLLQTAMTEAQIKTEQIKAVAETSISGAQVYQGLASAALSGMNTLVTVQDE